MLSNFIKHYNDYEKDGEIINLNSVLRIFKYEEISDLEEPIYGIRLVFVTPRNNSSSLNKYTEFIFEDEFTRNNYHNQLVQLLTLEINI